MEKKKDMVRFSMVVGTLQNLTTRDNGNKVSDMEQANLCFVTEV